MQIPVLNMLVHKYVKHYFEVPRLHQPVSLKMLSNGPESPNSDFFLKSIKEKMT